MRTTKEHLKLFKNRCNYYIKEFGLFDWKVYYTHELWNNDSYADCNIHYSGRVATINLCTHWEELEIKYINKTIDELAFHEVSHIVLAELCSIASSKSAKRKDIDSAEHSVIRRMEAVLFNKKPPKLKRL